MVMGIPWDPPKKGVVLVSSGTGTPLCQMPASPLPPVALGILVSSAPPAGGPGGPGGEVLERVGGR